MKQITINDTFLSILNKLFDQYMSLFPRDNEVKEEFTSSADEKEHAPSSPIGLLTKIDNKKQNPSFFKHPEATK